MAMDPFAAQKRAAAEAAVPFISDGMTVGLGTGTTVAFFLTALAERHLRLTCVATSVATERTATTLGLTVVAFDADLDRLDVAVDGADQIAADRWLIKGGGGAHTREKVVAAAADRFVVVASSDKPVLRLRPPVPLELLAFGLPATLRHLGELGPVRIRDAASTPDGNVIADYGGPVDDPRALAATLEAVPGVVDHGLFAPELVTDVLVGRPDGSVEASRGR
ncbi:MAG TPA: ribose-5-phosphate isomerase RpiA [Actinobacteria bacterium]|jgi:ribose 5-phosphate isomerase A|nr:ribose-5-phosphate isomerase RpiA [Actinomycetota bacterium]HCP62582.1 ribose-5-phosphate isomerase RpiA [Actinomycetota bacterium]